MAKKSEKNQVIKKGIAKRLSLIITIGMSLLVLILIGAGVLAAVTLSFNIYNQKTDQIAHMCSRMIDGDYIEELTDDIYGKSFSVIKSVPYGSIRENAVKTWLKSHDYLEEFETYSSVLERVKETMGASYIYVTTIDGDVAMDILDPDDIYNSVGYETILLKEFRDKGINKNEKVEPIITNGQYGWLSSGGYPIYNSKNEAVAVVFVDVNVVDIISSVAIFVIVEFILSTIFVILIIVFVVNHVKKRIARPVEQLTKAVDEFANSDELDASSIVKLNINTGDEIEVLYNSTQKMQENIIEYMENLTKVTAEKERIGAELNVANQIQADMLPRIFPPFPDKKEFDLYASMVPAKEVGGDFYDFFMIDDDHLALVMADVSGKGVPAALFMVIAKTLIKNRAYMGGTPSEILAYANEQLCEGNEADLFVTVWMAIIELSTGKGIAVNAGHEHPVIRRAGGEYELVVYRHSPAVAIMEGMSFKQHEFQLGKGDSIFVYTDGVPESTNDSNVLMGTDRMLEALNKNPDAEPKEVVENVNAAIKEFVGNAEQFDDTTMLSFIYYGLTDDKNTENKSYDEGSEGNLKEFKVGANVQNLSQVISFIDSVLEENGCPMRTKMQIDVAVEEIYVNIASYAYGDAEGEAIIRAGVTDDPKSVEITFIDSGIPYDPLKKEDPDVTLSADKRPIGGLGIFMVKKSMDDMIYEYKDGQNCLTIKKNFE